MLDRRSPRAPLLAFAIAMPIMLSIFTSADPVAAQTSVTAEVDRRQLTTDETLLLTLEVISESAAPTPPSLPEMPGLTMIGRSSFAQMTVLGGEVRRSSTYQFQLEPNRIGTLTIPSIELQVDGQTLRTQPIEIVVQPGRRPTMAPPSRSAETDEAPYSVEAAVDKTRPYVGEAVAYIFRLNQRVRLSGRLSYVSPDFEGLLDKFDPQQQARDVRVGGRPLRVTEIRTLLFPIAPGPLEIGPAKLEFRGGFGFQASSLETEALKIDVRPLPAGAPEGFDGAVGRFEIAAGLRDRMQPRVGEPLPLIVRIEGEGNIDALTEPRWPKLPEGWRSYEGQVATDFRNAEGRVEGSRSFERLLVPSTAGRVELPPITFSFFDPDRERYETVATSPIVLEIEPSNSADGGDLSRDATTEEGPPGLRAVRLETARRSGGVSPLVLLLLFGLLPLALFGAEAVQGARRQRDQASLAAGPSPAFQTARDALRDEASRARPDPRALLRVLESYLDARTARRVAGLPHADLLRQLEREGVRADLCQALGRALDELELVMATGADLGAASRPAALAALLEELETGWPR